MKSRGEIISFDNIRTVRSNSLCDSKLLRSSKVLPKIEGSF